MLSLVSAAFARASQAASAAACPFSNFAICALCSDSCCVMVCSALSARVSVVFSCVFNDASSSLINFCCADDDDDCVSLLLLLLTSTPNCAPTPTTLCIMGAGDAEMGAGDNEGADKDEADEAEDEAEAELRDASRRALRALSPLNPPVVLDAIVFFPRFSRCRPLLKSFWKETK